MKYYEISLQPVTPYFFGKEQVAELGNKKNYYLESAFYPQQTALLGMLRYQVLLQEELIPITSNNETNVIEYIGSKSFDGSNQNFGCISRISPVQVLYNGSEYYLRDKELCEFKDRQETDIYPLRKLYLSKKDKGDKEFIEARGEKTCVCKYLINQQADDKLNLGLTKDWLQKYNLKGVLVKKGTEIAENQFLTEQNKTTDAFFTDLIFQESQRVGIEKSFSGGSKLNAFYKQSFIDLRETEKIKKIEYQQFTRKKTLQPSYVFFFQLEWDKSKNISFNETERLIIFGGEQSVFSMSVKEVNKDCFAIPAIPKLENNEVYKLILISDTLIEKPDEFCAYCLHINGELARFKNFVAYVNKTQNYRMRGEHHNGFKQSDGLQLYKRGSVFYFADKNNLQVAINIITGNKKPENGTVTTIIEEKFRNIGYNYFIITKEKIY